MLESLSIKETTTHMLSCEYCKIFKNTYFEKQNFANGSFWKFAVKICWMFCKLAMKLLLRHYPAGIYLVKVAIETIDQGVKYAIDVVLVSLLLTLNIFHILL